MWANSISGRVLRHFSTEAAKKVLLPDLKFGYSALEPVISSKLLETHHKKHHQTYVNNLNAALEQFEGIPPPTQRPRPTSTTTNLPPFVRPSNSTWAGTSTTQSTGRTSPPSARAEANTPPLSLPSPSRSPNSSAPTRPSLTSSPRRPSPSRVPAGDGSPMTTAPNRLEFWSWPTRRCWPLPASPPS